MNPLEHLRPAETESTVDFWYENESRWFIHRELQHIRSDNEKIDPFQALYQIATDPRTESLDYDEFSLAFMQQFMRFQERKPQGIRAAFYIMEGLYKDQIWGLASENY